MSDDKSKSFYLRDLMDNESVQILRQITFGRRTGDVIIENDVEVSGKHCTIFEKNGKIFILDHHSKNHTKVNDQIIPAGIEIEISLNDQITFGSQKYILSDTLYGPPQVPKQETKKISPELRVVSEEVFTPATQVKQKISDIELKLGEDTDVFDAAVLEYKEAMVKQKLEFEKKLLEMKKDHMKLLEENFQLQMKILRIERQKIKKSS